MLKKFECKECKTRFEADDAHSVVCPHCQSDNVDYAHFHISAKVWKIITGCVFGGLIVWGIVSPPRFSCSRPDGSGSDSTDSTIDTPTVDTPIYIGFPILNIGEPVEDEGYYTVEVAVENPGVAKIYYAILDPYDNSHIIAKDDKGHFTKIPSSKADGGVYDIAVFDAKEDTIICKIDKPGFIPIVSPPSDRMSKEDLQDSIDARALSLMGKGENNYLASDYTLKFVGLSKDAVNVPTILAEVFEKLNFSWTSVKVISLRYDNMNRISEITMKVEE